MPDAGAAAAAAAAQQVGAAPPSASWMLRRIPTPPRRPAAAATRPSCPTRAGRLRSCSPSCPPSPPEPGREPAVQRGTRRFRAVSSRGLPEPGRGRGTTCPPDPSRAAGGCPSPPRPQGTAPALRYLAAAQLLRQTPQLFLQLCHPRCRRRLRAPRSHRRRRSESLSPLPQGRRGEKRVRAWRRGGGKLLPARPLLRERGEKRCCEPHK